MKWAHFYIYCHRFDKWYTFLTTETSNANCTYGLYQENTKSGVMKKSAMVVNVLNKQATQTLLTVSET